MEGSQGGGGDRRGTRQMGYEVRREVKRNSKSGWKVKKESKRKEKFKGL